VIHTFISAEELASELAGKVFRLAEAAIRNGRPFHLALSGGSTPRILFERMASLPAEERFWEQINFYWADERCVPPDHPDSNFRMTEETLFRPLTLSQDKVFRMRGEAEPLTEADRYGSLLRTKLPARRGMPRFDLILLGMGTDGHTASIFPGQPSLIHSKRICEVARHPETGQNRITLTGTVINHAERVCFMVTGAGKAAVLAAILKGRAEAADYPAAHIRPVEGMLEWYLDAAAAVQLSTGSGN
jgi:6-phosphogluconolactonase